MIRIGEFSKLSQISIRMLRYFDDKDLIKPTYIDKETGYRYYESRQLLEASRILSFQRMGFTIQEIQQIFSNQTTSETKELIFQACKERKVSELEEVKRQITMLGNFRLTLERSQIMKEYNPIIKTVPEHQAASLRMKIEAYEQEGMLWGILYKELGSQNPKFSNPPRNLAIYQDAEYVEENPDVEIQVSVEGSLKDTEHVKIKMLPADEVLSITFEGGFQQITEVNAAAVDWIEKNNYTFNGKMYNIYLVGPGDTEQQDKWVTECCFPVKKQ